MSRHQETIKLKPDHRALRALTALVVLVAVCVAVPIVLATWGRWPLTGIPGVDGLRRGLERPVSDSAVFGGLTLAAWATWGLFVLSVLSEMHGAVVQRRAMRVPLAGPVQRLARYLIISMLMSAASAANQRVVSDAAELPVEFVTDLLPGAAGGDKSPDAEGTLAGGARANIPLPTDEEAGAEGSAQRAGSQGEAPSGRGGSTLPAEVVVQPNDTAWGIAEDLWGDGLRWRDLWEANQGKVQPDGRCWTDPDLILPGWVFDVPGGSPAGEPTPSPDRSSPPPEREGEDPGSSEEAAADAGFANVTTISVGDVEVSGPLGSPPDADEAATPHAAAGETYLVGDGVIRYLDPATLTEAAAIRVPGHAEATIDNDGILWVVTPRDGMLRKVVEGEVQRETPAVPPGHTVSMTLSGNRPVIIDRESDEMWTVDRRTGEAGGAHRIPGGAQSQAPSTEGDRVWLVAGRELLGIGLDDDSRVTITLPSAADRPVVTADGVSVSIDGGTVLTFDPESGELTSTTPS